MNNLRERIRVLMKASDYQPLNKSEFARSLRLKPNERSALRAELLRLENKGLIVRGKKGRFDLKSRAGQNGGASEHQPQRPPKGGGKKGGRKHSSSGPQLVGTIRFQASGNAWFYPDSNDASNEAANIDLQQFSRIFISSNKTSTAMNGDKVRVRIDRIGPPEWANRRRGRAQKAAGMKAPDDEAAGYVDKIIERGMSKIIGTYFKRGQYAHVQPDDAQIPDVNIEPASKGSKDTSPEPKGGQKVAVALTQWDNPNSSPRGKITEVLGWPDTPGVDMLSIVHKHGLRSEFPDAVLKEARNFGDEVTEKDLVDRDDWRDLTVITIDPHDAKDFDDAISVRKLKNGDWQLGVHIADVSHYVKPGTALDKEAVERGNSTYMADRVLPMIPRELSNHLCSLMPHVDRLTQCCLLTLNQQGRVKSAKFTRAVIHSARRYTYEEAQEILMAPEDKIAKLFPDEKPEIAAMLHEAWRLASLLRKRRFENGALDLDMPEVKVVLDDKGKPIGIEKSDYNESHQLIEEFMLIANEAAAKLLKNQRQPTVYRIHEDPDPDRLNDYAELAKLHGYKPGDLTNKKHIQALLDKAKGTIEEPAIKIGLLKSLKRAAYFQDPLGHYGLSKENYCHFTSPIRRYADLIVHRALQRHLGNPPKKIDRTPGGAEMAQIAQHISETERTSAEAENESRRLKMLQYLHMCSVDENPPSFNVVVTEVRHFGLFVEAVDIQTKGLIKLEDLPPLKGGKEWQFEANLMRFTGPYGQMFTVGQQHLCHVSNVDMEQQRVDFKLVDNELKPVEGQANAQPVDTEKNKQRNSRSEKPNKKPSSKRAPSNKKGPSKKKSAKKRRR
ncbi:ribonuclease R [Verrucomicrobiaceae bacterium 5K15]|uniref:Ribonuclease R n=1 Tax=Oceaniferula flava TaxID=2800421 RepID=A0AAE2S9C4_9BACT|nr:ribonuclease R [Oceaniferula flavus]MBK1853403.1 ribonuclease R [Oceaniferula flavus]MBM1134708.1 ribonuclease R [Oceaniferula flavus]